MSSPLKKLLSIELWSSSVTAFSKTFDYAEELKDREDIPALLKSVSSALDNSSGAQAFLEASSVFIPYAKLASLILDQVSRRNDAKDYPECISIAFLVAYLESLAEFSKDLLFSKSKRTATAKKLGRVEVNRREAGEALDNFPTSKLATTFGDCISLILESYNLPTSQKTWLVERAKWGTTPERMFERWSKMPDKARLFKELSIAEKRNESESIRALEKYLNRFDCGRSTYGNEDLQIPLTKLYVPLNIKEVNMEGEEISNKSADIHSWISDFLIEQGGNEVLFVQGNSGQGKTAFCQMFFKYIKESIYPAYAPVFIRLRDIENIKDKLQETLNNYFEDVSFFQTCDRWLTDDDRRFIILLDGFDELSLEEEEDTIKFVKQIVKFQKGHHQFIITGRYFPAVHMRSAFESTDFSWLKILPMSSQIQSAWIDKWSRAALLLENKGKLSDNIFSSCFDSY